MIDDDNSSSNRLLYSYLNDTLPTLGLDPETYSPYVMGCLETSQEEHSNNNDENDILEDLTPILELLRASSETHSEDDTVWENLRDEILNRYKTHVSELIAKKNVALLQLQKVEEEKRQFEIEVAKEAQQREMEIKQQQQNSQPKEMSAAKRALLDQYAYDTTEQYDNDGNLIDPNVSGSGGGGKEEEVMTNRAVAQKANAEKTQDLRNAKNGTQKNEERIKTKNAKLNKLKQKEERRARASKGERKR